MEYTLEQVKSSHQTLKKRLEELFEEKEILEKEILNFHKRIKIVEDKLRLMCSHEWIRPMHLYSNLKCKNCGVLKR